MGCLDDDAILDLLADRMDELERRAAIDHLDTCGACRRLIADAADADDDTDRGDDDLDPSIRLGAGAAIGRYVIDRVLGAGAMGIVYAAHDPQLRRAVALKILRRPAGGAEDEMLREARTLAQLSHPNVIAVHDADVHATRIFIAMELVVGPTLGQWLGEGARAWHEVRDVFLQAGRGLEAAHAAGLVHRDFKPDNVLVGDDGRVRVTDFGLARGVAVRGPAGVVPRSSRVLAGTPAYMSPEQLAGEPVDARSDLYSFCVTLHQALTGERPRAGRAIARRIPRRIRRALDRGLRAAADERHRDMAALLAELARGPLITRRRIAVAAGAGLALAGAAVIVAGAARTAGPEPCTEAGAAWGSVWDDAQRATARTAFDATRRPDAPDGFARADAILTGYRGRWIAAHTATCLASHRGEQSPALLDRRMRCLADRREHAAAHAELLGGADAELVGRAVDVVLKLEPVGDCDAQRVAIDLAAPPVDPRFDDLTSRLARIKAQLDANRRAACARLVEPAVADARALGYAPVLASLLYYRARCEDGDDTVQADLHAAAVAAEAGHDDETLALVWIRLMFMTGYGAHRWDEAKRWEAYARAAIDRRGGDDALELQWGSYRALNQERQGQLDEARAVAVALRARAVRRYGEESVEVARVDNLIANTYTDAWRWREGLGVHQHTLAILEKIYGAASPQLEIALINLVIDLRGVGRTADALAVFPRLFAAHELASPGGDDSSIRTQHAGVLVDSGDGTGGLDEARRAHATCERFAGPRAARCAFTYHEEARALIAVGRFDDAAASARASIDLAPQPDTAFVLARALERRDPAGARVAALEAWENVHGLVTRRHGDRRVLDDIEAWLGRHGGVPAAPAVP